MTTKTFAFVFALFAVTALLTACGGSDTAPEPSTDGTGGDAPVDQETAVVIDDAIVDESDDVEIGELI